MPGKLYKISNIFVKEAFVIHLQKSAHHPFHFRLKLNNLNIISEGHNNKTKRLYVKLPLLHCVVLHILKPAAGKL